MIALPPLARFLEPLDEVEQMCELCGAELSPAHRHVVELGKPGLQCACHGCAVLFSGSTSRYRTVPERYAVDPAFPITPARWQELGIPVGLAFCVVDSTRGPTASFPGAAGVTELPIPSDSWSEVLVATPLAGRLIPDVEALVLAGECNAPAMRCALVPICAAYELAATIRQSWSGFSGGDQVRAALARFFAEIERRAT